MAINITYREKGGKGSFRDYLFENEESLKRELGDNDIRINKERNIIIRKGIQFLVDENGKITKIEGIVLNETKKRLKIEEGIGEQAKLIATLVTIEGEITWKSSNEEVVTIEGIGETVTITGIKDGTAIITATCQGEEASCEVMVKTITRTTILTVEPTTVTIQEKEMVEIVATQDGTEDIEWESSDPSVANVVGTGEENKVAQITGITPGTTNITAKTKNRTATATVTVVAESILDAISKMNSGGAKQITVNGKTKEGMNEVEKYGLNVIYWEKDLTIGSQLKSGEETISIPNLTTSNGTVWTCGTTGDIGKNTVVLKVEGNLTIEEGKTLTTVTESNDGPKGMLIYCKGELVNKGTINMSGRGSSANGQNVYLYKNNNDSFEYIPKVGSIGGDGFTGTTGSAVAGKKSKMRQCAGGRRWTWKAWINSRSHGYILVWWNRRKC